ncbi:MAG: CDP-alcohol phosphatidyltransferase family protein [Bdellovibrionota bacterium]
MKSIPNLLTILRVLLALMFPFVDPGQRLLILTSALLTEFLDGFIARIINAETVWGRVADPIADRLVAASVALTFFLEGSLSGAQIFVLLIRDITVVVGLALTIFYVRHLDFIKDLKPSFWGKVTTATQYLVFLNVLFNWVPQNLLIGLACTFSIMAAILYVNNFLFGKLHKTRNPRFF